MRKSTISNGSMAVALDRNFHIKTGSRRYINGSSTKSWNCILRMYLLAKSQRYAAYTSLPLESQGIGISNNEK